MKISIYYDRDKLEFNPNTEKNVGVSGTHSTIINLAKSLSDNGHDVTVYVRCNFPNIYDGVKYYQYYDYQYDNEDVVIGFESFPTVLRTGHGNTKLINYSTNVSIPDVEKYPEVDYLIVMSGWHRDRYASELSPELVKKMVVVEPGVIADFFNKDWQKWPLSVTYAGHPSKGGMQALIQVAKRLKPINKDISIHAYGGGEMWGWDDEQYRPLYDDMIRARILYHGQCGIKRMVKQLNGSQIFIYPVGKHHQETFCLAVLQAMASGCVVIASDNGNIRNLVKDAGFTIPGIITDYKWAIEATDKILELFSNPTLMEELSTKAREYARIYSWQETAKKVENLL